MPAVRSLDHHLRHGPQSDAHGTQIFSRGGFVRLKGVEDVAILRTIEVMSDKDRDEVVSEPRTTPPGEGERRAIGGYYPQYRVAAALTLRGLRDGTLDAIRLRDPEAGRIDDIQIIGRTKLDAFQVKWSRYDEALTFRDLTRPEGSSPPLIAQLGEGWNRLRAANVAKRVVVHLVTNRRPSANDHI